MEQLELEDGLRLTEMATRAGITVQSMGELVDDLEAKGYLQRRPDPKDRRAKRIHLTKRGRNNARIAKQATADAEDHLAAEAATPGSCSARGRFYSRVLLRAVSDETAAPDRTPTREPLGGEVTPPAIVVTSSIHSFITCLPTASGSSCKLPVGRWQEPRDAGHAEPAPPGWRRSGRRP